MLVKNLHKLRKQFQLSVEEAAQKIGVGAYEWELWENGNAEPSVAELIRISEEFSVLIDTLLKQHYMVADPENIRLLLLDVDGVMTDGGMYYSENGDFMKKYNAKDGLAIRRAQKTGLEIGFISSSSYHNAIFNRAEVLKVKLVHVGDGKKIDIVEKWLSERNLSFANLAYIGDDLNDIALIRKAGLSACPSDACKEVKAAATLILPPKGGEGCVRYFIEEVLSINLELLGLK
ncbi:MAG: helix-turn-helix domain-containing protein [Bacteroidia bacterium]|nr:helix-turn-helix domain-containing protein [Bacteroidia bacterium]